MGGSLEVMITSGHNQYGAETITRIVRCIRETTVVEFSSVVGVHSCGKSSYPTRRDGTLLYGQSAGLKNV